MFISVSDGQSPIPVAVKPLPLIRFPLSLSLDDSNAMIPERLLSAQQREKYWSEWRATAPRNRSAVTGSARVRRSHSAATAG
ncbi:c-type cytochrome biogenesis protein CcmI/CycH [Sodalis glossinidius]|uniref:c-type cytochrome biogenesis protein CcmI/CycH n=1 Tax=Sodalis glossinidius TaxID=63612 RepID=UPI003C73BF65